MTKPYTCHPKFYDPLRLVTTVTEASEKWDRRKSTIRYAIDAENIAAVQSGKTWLISVPSLVAFWGYPPTLSGMFDYANMQKTPLQIIEKEVQNGERASDEQRPALPPHLQLFAMQNGILQPSKRR